MASFVEFGGINSNTPIVDETDPTKKMVFDCSGIPTATTRTFTMPTSNGNVLTDDSTDTLTNKTAISNNNNLIARGLWIGTGSGSVSTYAASPPTTGQVLTATSGSVATWQTPTGGGGGEANTTSSDGGTSLVKAKVGIDLPFKGLTATSNKITLTSNTNDIGINVNESNLSLNNIGGTLNVNKGGTGVTSLTAGNILRGNGTGSITSTLVAPSGDIVGTTDAQTLTNKTGTSNTNNLISRALWVQSGSGSVSTYAAAAPTNGQVLTATTGSNATWQNPSVFGENFQTADDTAFDSTTSAIFQLRQRLTTPSLPSGTYRIEFLVLYNSRSPTTSIEIEVLVNSTRLFNGDSFVKEGKDANVDQREHFTGSDFYTGNGVLNIDINYRRSRGSGTPAVRYSKISIWRIS